MTVFSFHPVKILTTGEGGMILTNRPDLHRKLMRLRSHGITREMEEMDQRTEGPWYYEQLELGYNYRLTDIQAALGISQLARLDEFVLRRRQLAARYDRLLADLPVVCPAQKGSGRSSYHLYPVCVRRDPGSKKRLDVFKAMRASGIGVNVHYIPVHLQPYYRQLGFHEGDFPEAERYYEGAITLPLYYSLSESEQDRVVATLRASMA
jgi:dTDP-4-amino-4,6-dideoxygalactose transaminase